MASQTLTIEEMLSHPLTRNIFPDNYPFYVDDEKLRKEFEEKFIAYFYYREIGFETPFIFKQRLHTLLMIRMPYWKQLYETELEAKNINFLLNKDLRETFIREVETENEVNGANATSLSSQTSNELTTQQSSTATSSGTQTATTENTVEGTNNSTTSTTSSTTTEGTTTNTHKESSLNDGVAQVSLTEGYLTGTSQDNGTSSQTIEGTNNQTTNSTSSQTSNGTQSTTSSDETEASNTSTGNSNSTESSKSSGTSKQEEVGKTVEKTELISQGNIGVTSSAQLLKEWREVLINMDEIIINECKALFLKIY